MEGAATAIQSLLGKKETTTNETATSSETTTPATTSGKTTETIDKAGKDTTADETVAAPVTKEHITKTHEEKIQNVVDKEKHQDHYQTVVQPLEDRKTESEVHDYKTAEQQNKTFNKDDGAVAAKVKARENEFTSSTEEGATLEQKTREETVGQENVHHHLHKTIQPVIEKEVIKPSVTHTKVPIKEVHQEQSVDHGVVKNAPMSVDQFAATETSQAYSGAPKVNEAKD